MYLIPQGHILKGPVVFLFRWSCKKEGHISLSEWSSDSDGEDSSDNSGKRRTVQEEGEV